MSPRYKHAVRWRLKRDFDLILYALRTSYRFVYFFALLYVCILCVPTYTRRMAAEQFVTPH